MNKKIFVTTFNFSLFEKYANRLIDSFIKTDQSLKLYCYVEDNVDLYPKNKNIVYNNDLLIYLKTLTNFFCFYLLLNIINSY